MASISLNALKSGDFINVNGQPFIVLSTQHSHIGRGGATLRVKMKNLISGVVLENTFKGDEKIKEAEIKKKKATFLYADENNAFFMDTESYEQFYLSSESLAKELNYLREGSEVDLLVFEKVPVSIELPPKVELKVVSAPPGMRGNTAQGSVTKQVTLETGLVINAPIFIKEGDIVRVNTERGEYVERV